MSRLSLLMPKSPSIGRAFFRTSAMHGADVGDQVNGCGEDNTENFAAREQDEWSTSRGNSVLDKEAGAVNM